MCWCRSHTKDSLQCKSEFRARSQLGRTGKQVFGRAAKPGTHKKKKKKKKKKKIEMQTAWNRCANFGMAEQASENAEAEEPLFHYTRLAPKLLSLLPPGATLTCATVHPRFLVRAGQLSLEKLRSQRMRERRRVTSLHRCLYPSFFCRLLAQL